MVVNDIKKDVKIKCLENGTTLRDLGEVTGTSGQYVSRLLGKSVINKMFVKLIETLGYDIRLVYVKRDDNNDGE